MRHLSPRSDRAPWLANLAAFKLVGPLCGTLYIAHICACGFYWVGYSVYYGSPEGSEERERSWLFTSSLDMKPMPGLTWDELGPPYVASLYWTYTTITTVGYGDLTPKATAERIYATIIMIIGTGIFGYILASVTAILTETFAGDVKMKAKLKCMRPAGRKERARSSSLSTLALLCFPQPSATNFPTCHPPQLDPPPSLSCACKSSPHQVHEAQGATDGPANPDPPPLSLLLAARAGAR